MNQLTTGKVFLDFHVLQVVPPSCINRDDTGSPKTAVYGGVQRSRVSSQAWKHAMRAEFVDLLGKENVSYRTKQLVKLMASALEEHGFSGDAEVAAKHIFTTAGLAIKDGTDKKKDVDALFFISNKAIRNLAKAAMGTSSISSGKYSAEEKGKLSEILKKDPGVEIALFGRMLAGNQDMNIDASAQVAHAISTHAVNTEFDYFTAVDDVSKDDSAGAGHLGTVEFNSATLYRYATLAAHELKVQIGDSVVDTAVNFMKAFVISMPTGKQNSFANRTLPNLLMVTLRTDQPINLVGAFEKAIPSSTEGYLQASAKALEGYAKKVYANFAGEPSVCFTVGEEWSSLGRSMSMKDMEESLKDELRRLLY